MAKDKIKLIPWDKSIVNIIQKRGNEFSEFYLNQSLGEKDERLFLIAIGHIIRASQGGIEGIAQKTGLGVRTIYRLVRGEGQPTQKTLDTVLKALGFGIKTEIVRLKKKKVA